MFDLARLALAGFDELFLLEDLIAFAAAEERAFRPIELDAEAGAVDRRILALARESGRVLVTFDADFGTRVYQRGEPAPQAILYLRMHPIDGAGAAALALQALAEPVRGQFVVCTREGLRRRPLPPGR